MNLARVGLGSCGVAAGANRVKSALEESIAVMQLGAQVHATGCVGLCYREVLVELVSSEMGSCLYGGVSADLVPELLRAHFRDQRVVEDYLIAHNDNWTERPFFAGQTRIVLRNCGTLNPESIDDYLEAGGYRVLVQTLCESSPEEVIDTVERAGLRGRGGAGFPTATKWAFARRSPGDEKFVVCNADEGDPGAFMDRNLIEGDPFAILEGMTLAAFAIGANRGVVYVRDEYPLAVKRLQLAVAEARGRGYLGANIADTSFSFDVSIKRGAGAFVCGEETAMIAAIEGRRGTPRIRPPYPVEEGLFGRPTVINNVETYANVPWILAQGADAFRAHGVGKSRGTKVFSLAGDVRRTGLIEVPLGTSLAEIVYEIGGGSSTKRPIKAVQLGGPSGGCLPASMFEETPVDYESLAPTGAIMGSGGIVVMDASTRMVDVARYFLEFAAAESCGKCTFCRIGTVRMLDLTNKICAGKGRKADLEALEVLAGQVKHTSLCGLGKSVPNPVLTTLRYFRDEYEQHLKGHCPSGRCRDLITFEISTTVCEGCTLCLEQCALAAISKLPRIIPLAIDADVCTRCGGCFHTCPFDAISVR